MVMANMNVRKRLEKIEREMREIIMYVEQYHGVPKEEARQVDNEASNICQQAARLCTTARIAMGDKSAPKLAQHVRKALGYTYP
jgi:Asp-tRNA(Asn)/Glu-tRNA(Gln) amidotransferase C subunit